jgi:hypothetical protein
LSLWFPFRVSQGALHSCSILTARVVEELLNASLYSDYLEMYNRDY